MIYLYVKTHNQTGLKYFGKTKYNPHRYKGSGKYWLRHLSKHGDDVSTQIVGEFDNIDECSEFAATFSRENKIVESNNWANLRDENGLDGAPIGHSRTQILVRTKSSNIVSITNSLERPFV